MTSSPRTPLEQQPQVAIGQVWRDNYDSKVPGYGFRHVKIVGLDAERALIHRCDTEGFEDCDAPNRYTKLTRFNGSKSGFTFVGMGKR